MIGIHNIRNATAAVALAFSVGLPEKYIKFGLNNFKGVQRRFSHLFDYNKSSEVSEWVYIESIEIINIDSLNILSSFADIISS